MHIEIQEFYPNLKLGDKEIGEITARFYVHAKYKTKREIEPMISVDFDSASYVDTDNRDVPLTKKDLQELDVYEFFVDDAVERFFEGLRMAEVSQDMADAGELLG